MSNIWSAFLSYLRQENQRQVNYCSKRKKIIFWNKLIIFPVANKDNANKDSNFNENTTKKQIFYCSTFQIFLLFSCW